MSYSFNDRSYISQQLENHIVKVHSIAKNANTKGKYIVFGVGSTQLLSAAVFALSTNLSSRANVVAEAPFYSPYKEQTDYFETARFHFVDNLKNVSDYGSEVIEFVTSPNNPDGNFKKPVFEGSSVQYIYDHAYYWPHFTAIPAPANEDVMIFTLSKLTGHAGSRFGWALVKDKQIYDRMLTYIDIAELGTSRDTQLRALQLFKAMQQGDGKEIFQFAYKTMRDRWEQLSQIISLSTRFTIQEIPPQFCTFFQKVRGPSPAYAWVKCERKEDSNCTEVFSRAKITGRRGSRFGSDERYVRLSLIRGQDDFDLLIHRLTDLVSEEN
ncbi:Kynurenine aminotransferase, glutamine transaminase K [Handroanthus impetiginosus]|uniref:Kynurenine aminotransferase, glutamine transaminase K n=1 Tax=Handroanthus impetiginosus TaxID=429701 RepID=A0A2G9HBM6_9LAMI|nr:Kynurenine aminotransferase, glutamine transaminase K [Handroanthus impetiginosus]